MRSVLLVLLASSALLSSSCLVWRNQWRHTVAVRVADDVAYLDDNDDKHRLDVFSPSGASSAEPLPVVIFVHGGWWRGGDRSYFEPIVGLYGNVGTALGDMGVVTVVPSYRLWPNVTSPREQLDDLAAVVAWTKQHIARFGGDPARIVLAGHSAGGHLVTMLGAVDGEATSRGLAVDDIDAVVAISGIYDVVTTAASADAEAQASFWTPFFGDASSQAALSPLKRFGSAGPRVPTLFLVGDADYPGCRRDFTAAQTSSSLSAWRGSRFATSPGNTHEDMVLEIGTVDDDVAPRIAAFARGIGH